MCGAPGVRRGVGRVVMLGSAACVCSLHMRRTSSSSTSRRTICSDKKVQNLSAEWSAEKDQKNTRVGRENLRMKFLLRNKCVKKNRKKRFAANVWEKRAKLIPNHVFDFF